MRTRFAPTILVLGIGTLSLCTLPVRADPGPLTPMGPGFNSSAYTGQLRSTVFATGLSYPTSMQSYAGGVLVGTTQDDQFYSSAATGHLLLLTDTNNDGKSDQTADLTPTVGLPGGITSVRQAGSLLFVTTATAASGPVINVLHQGATPTSPFSLVGSINIGFTDAGWEHTSYALATRPTPGQSGNYDVFFNLGSRANDVSDAGNFATYHATLNTTGNASGLSNVAVDPESIYQLTVSSSGSNASFSAPVKVAGGLRNSAGIAVHPVSGDLYFEDNGMDGSVANGHPDDKFGNAAYSLDTLHKINQSDIGVTVPSKNFATDFYENTRPVTTVHGAPDALTTFAAFGPFDASDANASPNESEGANEIAIAPSDFPAGLNNGVFVGFHGQFNKTGAPDLLTGDGNEENPVAFYDFHTGTYWHFVGTQEMNVGHLDGLLSTSDALYLSDLTDGSLFGAPFDTGTIYQISAVPEPVSAVALMFFGLLKRHRRAN